MPEGEQFIEIQTHGQTQLTSFAPDGVIGVEQLELVFVNVRQVSGGPMGHRPLAPVAADEAAVRAELVDGEFAVVGAQATFHRLDFVG